MNSEIRKDIFNNQSLNLAFKEKLKNTTERVNFDGRAWQVGSHTFAINDKKLGFVSSIFENFVHFFKKKISSNYANKFEMTVKNFEDAAKVKDPNTKPLTTLKVASIAKQRQITNEPEVSPDTQEASREIVVNCAHEQGDAHVSKEPPKEGLKEAANASNSALITSPKDSVSPTTCLLESVALSNENDASKPLTEQVIKPSNSPVTIETQELLLLLSTTEPEAVAAPPVAPAQPDSLLDALGQRAEIKTTDANPLSEEVSLLETKKFISALKELTSADMAELWEGLLRNLARKCQSDQVVSFIKNGDSLSLTLQDTRRIYMLSTDAEGKENWNEEPVGGSIMVFGDKNHVIKLTKKGPEKLSIEGVQVFARVPEQYSALVSGVREAAISEISIKEGISTLIASKKFPFYTFENPRSKPLTELKKRWLNAGELIEPEVGAKEGWEKSALERKVNPQD